jgi:hypothetical protein
VLRIILGGLVVLTLAGAGSIGAVGASSSPRDLASAACSSGYVSANLSWGTKCLRVGEYCKVGNPEYRRYGFDCPSSGYLAYDDSGRASSTTAPASSSAVSLRLGATILLGRRTQSGGCVRTAEPDRRCSPGAYYGALTKAVICSPGYRTGNVRDVPQSEKFQVETEYGMPASHYGRSIEIDHIVPLELGGSNDIANLFPEPGSGPANYHVKDELEDRLHDLVCAGAITLRAAQRGIASNWKALYESVFGSEPAG